MIIKSKLTDEQLENAVRAFEVVDSFGVKTGLAAAAHFLQVPWYQPTPLETAAFFLAVEPWAGPTVFLLEKGLREFVAARNAVIAPSIEVDPRIEKIESVLKRPCTAMDPAGQNLAKRILDAIDKQSQETTWYGKGRKA